MISIIIPVYNQANKLALCLDSIKKQTYQNFEIIIVNDGSTDNLKPVIDKYQPLFGLQLAYVSQENQGAPAARNRGAQDAKGEYFLFCDADITMVPEALDIMLKTLQENPQASYAYCSFLWGRKLFKLFPFDAGRLQKMPYIITTSLIRRDHFPGFDIKIKKFQDWDLWLTMLERGHIGVWIDKVLFKVYTGGVYSSWLPGFAYKLFPFLATVKKYNDAMAIIKAKHNLE